MVWKTGFLGAIILLASISVPAAAEPVFVYPGDSYQGQGITLRANGKCYVLTPAHVAHLSERTDLPELRVFGRGGKSSRATVEKVFDDPKASSQVDLAILALADGGGVTCDDAAPDPRLIDKALDNVARAIVQRVSDKGQITNSEALIRSVGATEINLTPGPTEDDLLHQGDSGSIIMIDRVPVAMLLSKGEQARGSRFTAIRLDTAMGLANTYFAGQRPLTRTFRFRSFSVTKPTVIPATSRYTTSRVDLPTYIASMERDLQTETERLLSGTRGFPQIDNGGGDTSTSGNLTLGVANVESNVRNICRVQRGKLFGINTSSYVANPGSFCHNGFEKIAAFMKITFRLSGDIIDAGGARVAIADQFTIILPATAEQVGLPLMSELSKRICGRTKSAVSVLAGGPAAKSAGGGIFGTNNEIVPDISGSRMLTAC